MHEIPKSALLVCRLLLLLTNVAKILGRWETAVESIERMVAYTISTATIYGGGGSGGGRALRRRRGGGGEGPGSGRSEKEEVVDKKAATSRGRSHISAEVKFVGLAWQEKI